jgi:hypothetical protein
MNANVAAIAAKIADLALVGDRLIEHEGFSFKVSVRGDAIRAQVSILGRVVSVVELDEVVMEGDTPAKIAAVAAELADEAHEEANACLPAVISAAQAEAEVASRILARLYR